MFSFSEIEISDTYKPSGISGLQINSILHNQRPAERLPENARHFTFYIFDILVNKKNISPTSQ